MIEIYDKNNNLIYEQYDNGRWYKYGHNEDRIQIYSLDCSGYWVKYNIKYFGDDKKTYIKEYNCSGMLNFNYPNVYLIL